LALIYLILSGLQQNNMSKIIYIIIPILFVNLLILPHSSLALESDIGKELTTAAGFGEVFEDNIGTYINRILKVVLGVGAIATLVMIMWGGVEWVTSGGDKNKYESARNRITAGIVGLALVAAGWGIWLLVLKFFNLDETELLDVESYIPAVGSQITTIASVKISEVVKFIQG